MASWIRIYNWKLRIFRSGSERNIKGSATWGTWYLKNLMKVSFALDAFLETLNRGFFSFFHYFIQHCFTCAPRIFRNLLFPIAQINTSTGKYPKSLFNRLVSLHFRYQENWDKNARSRRNWYHLMSGTAGCVPSLRQHTTYKHRYKNTDARQTDRQNSIPYSKPLPSLQAGPVLPVSFFSPVPFSVLRSNPFFHPFIQFLLLSSLIPIHVLLFNPFSIFSLDPIFCPYYQSLVPSWTLTSLIHWGVVAKRFSNKWVN